ncbi:glutamate racemase [Gillisia limnaea]|uniref:Glutamate racemase n=1 Tax=Gillisia limnaea (strain DSM 15749 / LMG 21470 / R-8282) TaxID=865937 RepID=H2BYY9_GILLR|nr:glutamate racemase [Gillisia limnaea]EHQ03334.1 glutamate racemase [Gillisia limnaea DSM 15749]
MNNTAPIGFFDSGVGGTSIWKEVTQLLPNENSIYLADSRNAPYGEKPATEIISLSRKNTEKLIEMGAKLIVVACNTATTNAIDSLRTNYSIPFIGIEPALKPAATNSIGKSIGILATKGTLTSKLFAKTSELYASNINIIEVVGVGLVKLIEEGKKDSPEMESLLRDLLDPMLKAQIDYLVLGCSHYPYLTPKLKEILPASVKIIDSGEAVARQTKRILERFDLFNTSGQVSKHKLFSNTNPEVLANLVGEIINPSIEVSYMDF